MLVSLAVRDFVLIDELTLELGEGLNVLSGETGAGKSILVDALALVLGGRARPEVVRTGREAAEVEALFDLRKWPGVQARLREAGLIEADRSEGRVKSAPKGQSCAATFGENVIEESSDDGHELVVRRVAGSGGRSKAYLNGRLVTASQLGAITRGLVDVSSQHESQTLCDVGTHGDLLDAFAKLGPLRDALGERVAAIVEVQKEIAAVRAKVEAVRAREDYLRFQLQEIDDLDPKPGEEHELEVQRARLRHADRLGSSTRRAADRLDDGEEPLLDGLRRVIADVASAAELDGSLTPHVRTLEGATTEIAEVARALSRYAAEVEADPDELGRLEERLFMLQRLLRKHGASSEDVAARRAQIAAELAALDGVDDTIATLEKKGKSLLADAVDRARALSAKRKEAARTLGEKIAKELSTLAMGRARIVVDVAALSGGSDDDDALAVTLEGGARARLTRNGIDRVELMIAPNPGEDPRPLRRIASGGELSRALLAVKRVLASTGPAGLYVFDEVDAGVGGAVADAIGRKIADVARHHQVLCITHLPQIAAFAEVHFTVAKREEAGRTISEVKRVEGKARVEELARMLGGATITKATRTAAEEMIRGARV